MKTCKHCGTDIGEALRARGKKPTPSYIRGREYCGIRCASEHRAGLPHAPAGEQRPKPRCKTCGADIDQVLQMQGITLTPRKLAQRKYCSQTCTGLAKRELPRHQPRPDGHPETIKLGHWPRRQQATPRDPKPCAHCGQDMSQIRYDNGRIISPYALARRKYCKTACANAARAERARSTKQDQQIDNPCSECGQQIPRKPGQTTAVWLSRTTCSPACRRKSYRKRLNKHRQQQAAKTVQVELTPADLWLAHCQPTAGHVNATCGVASL